MFFFFLPFHYETTVDSCIHTVRLYSEHSLFISCPYIHISMTKTYYCFVDIPQIFRCSKITVHKHFCPRMYIYISITMFHFFSTICLPTHFRVNFSTRKSVVLRFTPFTLFSLFPLVLYLESNP